VTNIYVATNFHSLVKKNKKSFQEKTCN